MAHLTETPLPGQLVEFYIRDIHIPDPASVLAAMHKDRCLKGRVLHITQDGDQTATYAMVAVRRLKGPCLVAIDRILRCW